MSGSRVNQPGEAVAVFVVIDLGCHECGVGSEGIGIYATADEARAAAEQRDEDTQGWRAGGQTFCGVFTMALPATTGGGHSDG